MQLALGYSLQMAVFIISAHQDWPLCHFKDKPVINQGVICAISDDYLLLSLCFVLPPNLSVPVLLQRKTGHKIGWQCHNMCTMGQEGGSLSHIWISAHHRKGAIKLWYTIRHTGKDLAQFNCSNLWVYLVNRTVKYIRCQCVLHSFQWNCR